MPFAASLLPADILQPFDIRYICDDLHVMAYFENHPIYEAVEAMIRRQGTGQPIVRAILTRHDQTQVDHVSDERLIISAGATRRETYYREVSVVEDLSGKCPHVKIQFLSHAGESVMFDITAASPPDSSRGGLSDPGGHAATCSLPIMWRGKSALAGEATRVVIAGVNYPVPVKFRTGAHFVAHNGYFTESHHMAVFRAGEVVLSIAEVPSSYVVGARWTYETVEGERTYRLVELAPDGQVRIELLGRVSEVLRGRLVGGRLQLQEIQILTSSQSTDRATLKIDQVGQFTIGIDENEGVVAGEITMDNSGTINLIPKLPVWAKDRQVVVVATRQQQRIVLTTVVGNQPKVEIG